MDDVVRKQVEHIGMIDLDFILSVASGETLTRITGTNHFLCIFIHALPPNLPPHLLDHSVISSVGVGVGNAQYVLPFLFRNQNFRIVF